MQQTNKIITIALLTTLPMSFTLADNQFMPMNSGMMMGNGQPMSMPMQMPMMRGGMNPANGLMGNNNRMKIMQEKMKKKQMHMKKMEARLAKIEALLQELIALHKK